MIAPRARRLCALAMPCGLSESIALETQQSLEGPPAAAAPSAIARILRHATSEVTSTVGSRHRPSTNCRWWTRA